jgi:hypothetical protein
MYTTNKRKSILRNRNIVLENIIIKLNLVKETLRDFNSTMFYEEGKKVKLSYTHVLLPVLVKAGIVYINSIDKYYNFSSKEITFDNLYNYWTEYKEKESNSKQRLYKKKIFDKEINELNNLDLEKAMTIVKYFGYKITKEF